MLTVVITQTISECLNVLLDLCFSFMYHRALHVYLLQLDIERLFSQRIQIFTPDAATPTIDCIIGTAIKVSTGVVMYCLPDATFARKDQASYSWIRELVYLSIWFLLESV